MADIKARTVHSSSPQVLQRKNSVEKVTMNKSLFLILIPCLVAYVIAQGYSPNYYGASGYGYGSGIPYRYYNYAVRARQASKQSNLLNFGLLFFFFLLISNITGSYKG